LLIQGQPMQTVPPNKRPVNTVFQNYALFPHLTIAQNVAFGLTVKRVPQAECNRRVAEALELVRLPGLGNRRPDQLSGGQQQRVALARALINRPAVLLLDEPLGALDLKLRKEMQSELKQLQMQVGITFIYVTHDQEEALTMSDRIAVMNHGNLLQVADPKTMYEQPATRFVADFIGETNFLPATVKRLEASAIVMAALGHDLVAPANGAQFFSGQTVTLTLRPEKISLTDIGGLTGTIREMIYIGTDTRYVVQLTSGETLVVRVPNAGSAAPNLRRVGDSVGLSWQPEDARVLTD
jgi:spermidine/putrescine transport system ATP-binding protein